MSYRIPPHLFRELTNDLERTARRYYCTQQLREQMAEMLKRHGVEPDHPHTQAGYKGSILLPVDHLSPGMRILTDTGWRPVIAVEPREGKTSLIKLKGATLARWPDCLMRTLPPKEENESV